MRHAIVAALVVSQVTASALAFAQNLMPPPPPPPPPGSQPPPPPGAVRIPAATTTTTQAAVDLGVPPPPLIMRVQPAETVSYVNRPLLTAAILLSFVTYVPAFGVAAESNRPSDNPNLFVPVLGPWLDLGQRDCYGTRGCVNDGGDRALLVLDGLGQGIGVLTVLTSFFVPERHSRVWYRVAKSDVLVVPSAIGSGYGLSARGRF